MKNPPLRFARPACRFPQLTRAARGHAPQQPRSSSRATRARAHEGAAHGFGDARDARPRAQTRAHPCAMTGCRPGWPHWGAPTGVRAMAAEADSVSVCLCLSLSFCVFVSVSLSLRLGLLCASQFSRLHVFAPRPEFGQRRILVPKFFSCGNFSPPKLRSSDVASAPFRASIRPSDSSLRATSLGAPQAMRPSFTPPRLLQPSGTETAQTAAGDGPAA
jgi:hypothetical protein